jgi:hypothetical protein
MAIKQTTRLDTAYALLDAYSALSPERLLEHMAPDFQHKVLPESLEMPTRDRPAFAQHAAGITKVFTKFAMKPIAVFEDPDRNAVIIHARMEAELQGGMGPWENECIMQLWMNEDGTKVVESKEFVDSAKAMKMKEILAEMFGKQKMNETMHD